MIERGGARVLVDPVSLRFLSGSEIDFVDDLIGSSFKVHNPNATASCGCGTSFSIDRFGAPVAPAPGNPDCRRGGILDCFASLAMTGGDRARFRFPAARSRPSCA